MLANTIYILNASHTRIALLQRFHNVQKVTGRQGARRRVVSNVVGLRAVCALWHSLGRDEHSRRQRCGLAFAQPARGTL